MDLQPSWCRATKGGWSIFRLCAYQNVAPVILLMTCTIIKRSFLYHFYLDDWRRKSASMLISTEIIYCSTSIQLGLVVGCTYHPDLRASRRLISGRSETVIFIEIFFRFIGRAHARKLEIKIFGAEIYVYTHRCIEKPLVIIRTAVRCVNAYRQWYFWTMEELSAVVWWYQYQYVH